MKVQWRRKIGRLERRWLEEKGVSANGVYDRATWRRMSSYIDVRWHTPPYRKVGIR